ncbi:MAG: WD40/YVTN/BNR-like repeat-containing protein [Streptosporangiaceae bacterium]
MPDRRDDLDSWLDGRIDPLPPPPGTFDLIKRRARRRKYRRLAVGAGAAAVIVAAAVAVPQMVNLPVLNPATAAGVANGHKSVTSAPPQARARPSTASSSDSELFPAPVGSVPGHFRSSSVTFISTQTGWVIGQAGTPGHCATQYCTSVAWTLNAGQTWTGLPAPLTGPADGATGVSQIRFLNGLDGWAFGPQLYATHDGGHTWARVATDGLRVTDLETVDGRAFALFASCTGTGPAFAARCTRYTLYSSQASADHWTPVGSATSRLSGAAASMLLTETRGYLLAPDRMLYSGPVNGPVNHSAPWQPVARIPCPVGQPLAGGQPTGALLAAANTANLVLACASSNAPGTQQAKQVFTSADGGLTWQNAGAAPSLGLATSVAATPDGTYVLATGQGIDVRPAGSGAWRAATLTGPMPAGGFGYVGMTTDVQGIALPADPTAGTVWFTFDGGQTWRPFGVS